MVSYAEAKEQVMDYLAGELFLEDLEDWSADASIDIHRSADDSAKRLVFSIRGLLNLHEDDDREEALKQALLESVVDTQSSSQLAELRAPRVNQEFRFAA